MCWDCCASTSVASFWRTCASGAHSLRGDPQWTGGWCWERARACAGVNERPKGRHRRTPGWDPTVCGLAYGTDSKAARVSKAEPRSSLPDRGRASCLADSAARPAKEASSPLNRGSGASKFWGPSPARGVRTAHHGGCSHGGNEAPGAGGMLATSGARCGPARIAPFSLTGTSPDPRRRGTGLARAVPASLSQVQPSSVRGGHSVQQARCERSALCPSSAWGASPENADPQNPDVRASISLACAAISLHPRCAVLASEARLQPRGSCSGERRLPPAERGPFQCKFLNRHAHNASLTRNSSAHDVCPPPIRRALDHRGMRSVQA